MAAYEVLLLNTAIPQIQAAQSGDTYVVPRDIAFSAALTLSAGTANGVPYLNASKVVTTGTALTFDGSNLGIGTPSPNYIATLYKASLPVLQLANSTSGSTAADGLLIYLNGANATISNEEAGSIGFQTSGTLRVTLDSSGNLGLGVTPSAWGSAYRSLDMRDSGAGYASSDYAVLVSCNAFQDGTSWKYKGSSFAPALYQQFNSAHIWYKAPSGTANSTTIVSGNEYTIVTAGGNFTTFGAANNNVGTVFTATSSGTASGGAATQSIVFSQAMTLDASGNLIVGYTAAASGTRVQVVGGHLLVGDSSTTAGLSTPGIKLRSENTLQVVRAGAEPVELNRQTNDGGVLDIYKDGTLTGRIGTVSGGMYFGSGTSGTERARFTSGGIFQVSSGGSVQVGGTAARATTAGTNRLDIFNGTAPVGTLTNGISIYSSSGEAYVMDAAGNATLFSPHDAETNEWIFKSKHTPTGKVLKIDVERLLKFVNDHFGLDAVHEFVEE